MTVAGGAVLVLLCCAVGPAVLGSAIGGWLGIACAALLAALTGFVLHRRGRC